MRDHKHVTLATSAEPRGQLYLDDNAALYLFATTCTIGDDLILTELVTTP